MQRAPHPHYYNQYGDQDVGDNGYYGQPPQPGIADQQPRHQYVGEQQQHQNAFAQQAAMARSFAYPLRGIPHPHAHDVLCGRGGQSNTHPGNLQWRTLVAANKELYVSLPKKQKMLLSQSIVNAVRSQQPPGRFLQKDSSSESWFDVGDKRAQEKTSQALREGAPEIRSKLKGSGRKSKTTTTTKSGSGRKKKVHEDGDDEDDDDEEEEINETNHDEDQDTPHPPEIPSIERNTSREQMPPPPVSFISTAPATGTIVAVPPAAPPQSSPARGFPEPKYPPMAPPAVVPSFSSTSDGKQHHRNDADEEAPPPPANMEGENFSFGSIALMSDAEQARLMNMAMMSSMPNPVDSGLDQTGFSFGSMMSIATTTTNNNNPGQRLEKGGLSIGSMMSYTMSDNHQNNSNSTSSNNKSVGGYPHKRGDSFGAGATEFTDIGTSFGSLSINPTDREMIIREAHKDMEDAAACAAMPTYLRVQKSRGDLLECSDSDEETEPEMVAQKSANWERLQAAIASQDARKPPPTAQGGMTMPLPPSVYNNNNSTSDPPMAGVPAMTEGVMRNFSNMSAISVGEDFEPQPYALPHMQQQQQQQQLHYAGGGVGFYSSHNNGNNGYASYDQTPELPLPLPNRKKSMNDDGWGDVQFRYDQHSYER